MRVVCLEWLSSVYCAGHWIPDQVEAAGGRELLGEADQPARPIEADRIADAGPRLVVLAPCGWGARETTQRGEKEGVRDALLGADDPPWVVAADADAHFSRPGPRLVGGVEWLSVVIGELRSSSRRPLLR